jgi:predicted DCC family thiol-disulfide oxidoreductase YuxK
VASARAPLLVYDGDCAFCTSAARWAERGWRGAATAVSWQVLGDDGLAARGLTAGQARAAAWWVGGDGTVSRGHRAIGEALAAGRGWRHAAGVAVLHPPVGWVASAAYPLVVRFRHRLPGATATCRVEAPTGRPR